MNNLIIRDDGYINATQLCKSGGKEFKHWYSLESTKKYLEYYKKHTDINLLYISKGRYGVTWCHPLLITNLAQWISIEFSVKVSIWIEEWKQINNNKSIYENEIKCIKADKNILKEKEIQLKLQKKLGGEIEVETESGLKAYYIYKMQKIREELCNSMLIFNGVVGKTRDEIEEKNRRIDEYNKKMKEKYLKILTDDQIKREYNKRIDEKIKIIEEKAEKEIIKLECQKIKI